MGTMTLTTSDTDYTDLRKIADSLSESQKDLIKTKFRRKNYLNSEKQFIELRPFGDDNLISEGKKLVKLGLCYYSNFAFTFKFIPNFY
jgi:Fe-S-cluster formation regulator IscX/YfhJ